MRTCPPKGFKRLFLLLFTFFFILIEDSRLYFSLSTAHIVQWNVIPASTNRKTVCSVRVGRPTLSAAQAVRTMSVFTSEWESVYPLLHSGTVTWAVSVSVGPAAHTWLCSESAHKFSSCQSRYLFLALLLQKTEHFVLFAKLILTFLLRRFWHLFFQNHSVLKKKGTLLKVHLCILF